MPPLSIPTVDPKVLRAGDTWRWDRVEEYSPADGWALTYEYRGASIITVAGTANAANTGWELAKASVDTTAIEAGIYQWTAFVSKAGERYTLRAGTISILPNLVAAVAGDLQPSAEVLLERVEAEILARLTGSGSGHNDYMIGDRSIRKFTLDELRALKRELKQEIAGAKRKGLKPIKVGFYRA